MKRQIDWTRVLLTTFTLATFLLLPFIEAMVVPTTLLEHGGFRDTRQGWEGCLSFGGVIINIFLFAICWVPLGIGLAHTFNPDWDFWDALAEKFPKQEPRPKSDPLPSDWRD